MLTSISIRNVVLIEKLELKFQPGLSVLTGETGAGKSILLDALGLATGARGEARLVRQGAEQASVSAIFEIPDSHVVRYQLSEQGIDTTGEPIILKRLLNADGRSRAFANDQAISVGLLNKIGGQLVEVHGQFDNQKLMRPESHLLMLDLYTGSQELVSDVSRAYGEWTASISRRKAAIAESIRLKGKEEFLRFDLQELIDLSPKSGEEAELSEKRKIMMNSEKLIETLSDVKRVLGGEMSIYQRLQSVLRSLENVKIDAGQILDEVIATFEAASNETLEGLRQLDRLGSEILLDPSELESTEERLFALKAVARKHQVEVDQLSGIQDDLVSRLSLLEADSAHLDQLEQVESEARETFIRKALKLREVRLKFGKTLDKKMVLELAELKLEQALFYTHVTNLEEQDWNKNGMDRVSFLVSTNPKSEPGPISRVASGGELARFMLALRVVLAGTEQVPTLVFDEVDVGIGGAVASAVGERLVLLGQEFQALVVTHSPQVAAKGETHWRISKSAINKNDPDDQRVSTKVEALDKAARQEEIARMLAGAQVTDEARAAAERLISGGET